MQMDSAKPVHDLHDMRLEVHHAISPLIELEHVNTGHGPQSLWTRRVCLELRCMTCTGASVRNPRPGEGGPEATAGHWRHLVLTLQSAEVLRWTRTVIFK